MRVREFGRDAQLLRAVGQAIAAGDAGAGLLVQPGIEGAGARTFAVIARVPFVTQDVGDGHTLL